MREDEQPEWDELPVRDVRADTGPELVELLPAPRQTGGPIAERTTGAHRRVAGAWLAAQESPNTEQAYKRDIAQWFAWCDAENVDPLRAVRLHVDLFRRWLAAGGSGRAQSNATIARKLSSLSSFYRYGQIEHPALVAANPVDNVSRPVPPSESQAQGLDLDECERLIVVAADRGLWEHAMVQLLLRTGIRVSEACGARTSDLRTDSGERWLTVTRKGGRRERVIVKPPVTAAVNAWLAGRTGHLLQDRFGKPPSRHAVSYRLGTLVRAAHITKKITPHCLRHTAATLLLVAGEDPLVVRDMLGHQQLETTMRYLRAATAAERNGAHRLDRILSGTDDAESVK